MAFSSVSEAIEGSSKKGQILTHKPASPQSADENSVEAVVERSNDCDSSEDDIEVVTDYADNFYITDNTENVVSILDLPLASRMFSDEISDLKQFYLFGKCDNGLQSVMHPINMWKLELGQEPEFSVRTQQGKWIWLKKPAKSYAAGGHRTALLVAHFLNFVRMNTDASGKEVWAHLRKISCFSEVEPSSNDLVQHSATIRKLVKDNPILEKAQILVDILKKRKGVDDFLAEKKQKLQEPNNSTFGGDVVSIGEVGKFETKRNSERSISEGDDPDLEFDADVNDSDGEDVGDTVCAICDDGGDILCCDGPCLRSFHATKAAAAKSTSQCVSFGFLICAVMEMGKFYCWNCQYNQHQCFACGQLGSSKEPLKEVFVCDVALCGRFYHPACAAKLLVSKEEHASFIERILNGVEAFSCPLHKCVKCKKGDMRESEETRLYGCRRCPRAWHKKCISDKICFYTGEDQPGIRGWEMDGTRFLYCLRHAIDDELGTPARNHLVFPNGHRLGGSKDVSFKKERKFASVGVSVTHVEHVKHTKCSSDESPRLKKFESKVSSIKELNRTIFNKPPPVPISHTLVAKKESTTILTTIKPKQPPTYNEDEMKKMLESLVEVSKKTVTSDTVTAKLMVPFIYEERATSVKKSISLGKLDSLLHALSKARECLLRGAIEEAECIFPKESFRVLERSKNKLRVYLAPILHGMRYTSFGRHFTKFDKLKEVVNRLHWYVNPGDMVVDFCCGSNDFSRLMFETLEHSRKKCAYKNYDIIQPKYDFNFIKKDWLKVERHELPSGDELVMGLNPPFGVKAQLANTMIDHVLTFKPKLIILIVPKETRRLESSGYECIWEDPDLLSGQAFYFPGSVDINDEALSQHNLDAPPLYLWSRGDWAARHHKIAAACRHVKFNDLNLQQIAEPISPQFCTLELMPEIHAFGVQSRKRQQATVSELTSINDGIGFDEEPTEIMHETILATNCNSFGADRPGRDLESLSSPKQKASDAGTLLEKKSSKLSHGKSKTLKGIKQQSRDRHHSELSGSKLEHISRSQTSHWPTPSPLEKGRKGYLRERLDSRHLIESKDVDRNFPSGWHRNDHQERADGRQSGDANEDRRRYEDRRPLPRSHDDDRMLEGFKSLQDLQRREEDRESFRHMDYGDERRPELQGWLGSSVHEEDRRYLEERQNLDDSRGLLDSAYPTGALIEHQRQALLHPGGLPFEAQRSQLLSHHPPELEREWGLLRQSSFDEASGHLTPLLRREGIPIRELLRLPNTNAEYSGQYISLSGQESFPLRASSDFHVPSESITRASLFFGHESAASRGLIRDNNESHPLSLSGHELPLNSRRLTPDSLLRNASLGAHVHSQLHEPLDILNSPMYQSPHYLSNN